MTRGAVLLTGGLTKITGKYFLAFLGESAFFLAADRKLYLEQMANSPAQDSLR